MVVSGVFNFANGTVGFNQRVAAVNCTSVAALVLGLVVTSVGVSHRVRVVVFWVRLKKYAINKYIPRKELSV